MSLTDRSMAKRKQNIGISIAIALITGSFFVFAYINTDAVINIQVSYDFTIRDFIAPAFNTTSNSVQNDTYTKNDVKLSGLFIVFDQEIGNKTNTEMNVFLTNQTREENQIEQIMLTHMIYMLPDSRYKEFRPQNKFFKLPAGNKLAFIRFTLNADLDDKDDLNAISVVFYGIVPVDQQHLKDITKQKLIIEITSLKFIDSAYDEYHNFMAGDTDIIPEVYPYQMDFELTKTPQTIVDFFRGG